MSRRPRRRGILRFAAIAAALAVVAGGLTSVAVTVQRAEAANAASAMLRGFDPADIIDDAVMFNGSAMSTGAIQEFLNARQPVCGAGATCLKSVVSDVQAMPANPMCKALPAAKQQTVAQIISAVGKACDVSPQVILVMLQKEQTLITGRTPYSGETVSLIYRKATGLGCPDTAPCDPAKYGLFNQLYGVAYWLVRYTMPPGTGPGTGYSSVYSWFPVGRANGVLYHPNAACGARTISIRNKATASLYYYTPYQPNDAALAAGWGLGNSCSAYGNRNFYLYYTTWFGSTHFTVAGAIATAWKAAGGANGALGSPVSNATATSDGGGGTFQRFANGTIYTSAAGTVAVKGAVLKEYLANGGPGGVLGWPRRNPFVRTGALAGTTQSFQKGTVYSSGAGTFAVTGAAYAKYVAAKFETGVLGYPTADPVTTTGNGGGLQQSFRGGRIVVSPNGAAVVRGPILTSWLAAGGGSGVLGWPKGDAARLTGVAVAETASVPAKRTTNTVQQFDGGGIHWIGPTMITVRDLAAGNYAAHGGPTGSLGWPLENAQRTTANGGGWSQRFARGTVVWTARTGARALTGRVLQQWLVRGGVTGQLGWPTSVTRDEHGVGGDLTVFTSGRIYSSKLATVSFRGDILAKYLQLRGPEGRLGWPTKPQSTSRGVVTQEFQHGTITWSSKAGAKVRYR